MSKIWLHIQRSPWDICQHDPCRLSSIHRTADTFELPRTFPTLGLPRSASIVAAIFRVLVFKIPGTSSGRIIVSGLIALVASLSVTLNASGDGVDSPPTLPSNISAQDLARELRFRFSAAGGKNKLHRRLMGNVFADANSKYLLTSVGTPAEDSSDVKPERLDPMTEESDEQVFSMMSVPITQNFKLAAFSDAQIQMAYMKYIERTVGGDDRNPVVSPTTKPVIVNPVLNDVSAQLKAKLADSVVAMFLESDVEDTADGWTILKPTVDTAGKVYNLCDSDPFVKYPVGPFGTAFLISSPRLTNASDMLLTARHCFIDSSHAPVDPSAVRYVFGFQLSSSLPLNRPMKVRTSETYHANLACPHFWYQGL
jgi:hypothetical protein